MKKSFVNLLVVLMIIAGVVFLTRKYFPVVNTTTTTDTIWSDTIKITEYIPRPYPVYIDTSKTDTVYIPTNDSLLRRLYLDLHQKYYSTYHYNDTIKNDSIGLGILKADITKNTPILYNFTYLNRVPTTIINTTNIYHQNELFIGVEVGLNSFSPGLIFSSKKGYLIGGNYDVLNNQINIGAYVNINKLKLW